MERTYVAVFSMVPSWNDTLELLNVRLENGVGVHLRKGYGEVTNSKDCARGCVEMTLATSAFPVVTGSSDSQGTIGLGGTRSKNLQTVA